MKHIFRTLLLAVCLLGGMTACQKGDGNADYGNAFVYIPQATVSGLIDSDYRVPSGGAENTCNFTVKDNNVNVMLGIVRSGKLAGKAFKVNVNVNEAKTSAAATRLGAEAMPSSLYSLPSTASIDDGDNSGSFYLSLDKTGLQSFEGKTLVLNVSISNPTEYELSKNATDVNVVVNVDALLALVK